MFKKDRDNRQSKKIYHYILFSILASLAVSVSISTFFITNRYQNIYLEKIKASENDRLIQASSTSNFMAEYAMNLALQIYFTPSFSKALFFQDFIFDDMRDAIAQLNHIRLSTSFIHSIYLYNHLNHKYIVSSSITSEMVQPREVFEDPFIDRIMNDTEYYEENSIYNGKALFIPRLYSRNVEDSSAGKIVYSLIYKNAFNNPDLSSVIINISSRWLEDILSMNINRGDDDDITEIFAVDNHNRVIIKNRHFAIMQDLGGEEWFSRIRESGLSSGYLIAQIDHEPMLINYYRSRNLQIDWTFISFKSYSSIISEIRDLRAKTLIFSLFLLLGAILIESIISNRLYRPIRKLLNSLETSQGVKNDYRITLKNNFFRIYLQQNIPLEKKDLAEEFSKFQINLDMEQRFMMVLLKIENYGDISRDIDFKALSQLKYGVLNKFSKEFSLQNLIHEVIVLHGNFMLIICNEKEGESLILDLFKQQKDYIASEFGISYSIFYSEPEYGMENISLLYRELISAAEKTISQNDSSPLSLQEFHKQEKTKFDYPVRKANELIEGLKRGDDFTDIKTGFDDIISQAMKHSHRALNYCITSLLLETNELVFSLRSYHDFPVEFEIEEMLDELDDMGNFDNLIHKFNQIFKEIITHQSKRHNWNEELIETVQAIVKEDYNNSLFSIADIADKMNLTSAYLGKIYKKSSLQSLNDYITQVRLDESMKLLRDSDIKISEIALSTGFSTANYYHIVFKKKLGMTPQQYRNSRQKRDISQ